MAVNILNTNSILSYIQDFIKAKNPKADIQPGSDLYDLILHGNAQTASKIFEELSNIENLQSIFTTFGDDLDLVSRNYNLVRKSPTFSTGYITFFTTSFTADIIIPNNSVVSTKGTAGLSGITFRTIGNYSMLLADKANYFNAQQGRYEITIPISSAVPGTLANANSKTISVAQTTISEIDGVVNYNPTTGGTDGEDDESLQQRCALSWVVSSIGTRDGYAKLLLDRDEVSDAYSVGPFDTDSVRPGGGVDVYCITTSALTDSVESLEYADDTYTPLTSQPVVDIIKVENLTLGYSLVNNVSYTFNKQVDNPFSGSNVSDSTTSRIDWVSPWSGVVLEGDISNPKGTFTYTNLDNPRKITVTSADAYKNARITFLTGSANPGETRTVTSFSYDSENDVATFTTNNFTNAIAFNDPFTISPRPNYGDNISIQYTYNEDIDNLQQYIEQSSRNVIGSNILIKNGYRGKLYLNLNIKLFSGYNFTTVKNKVENALVQYISTLKLGDDVQLSDLTVVAQTGYGTNYTIIEVDYVDFSVDATDSYITRWNDLTEGFNTDGVIPMENREYTILESLTIGQI